ncbi:hypothetical protein PsorP6_005886 [Peronosclerospora sorghi]|uniref:Uncharacterized protein n=1 Tax=Peronosclerospora sorghi TaxID=230839 RepID=A0ACC0W7J6_9STRA|nr:hypothetical protein PsorP6_005886 [Peronosclerospora sorghi]
MYASVSSEDADQQKVESLPSSLPSTSLFSSIPNKRVLIMLILAAIGLTSGLLLFRFVRSDDFNLVVRWLQTNGGLGAALYVFCFAFFVVLCFPSTAFELLAGYIFDFWLGLVLATTGKLVGSVLSYVIGRYLCRRQVRAYMARGHPALQGLQSLLQKRQVLVVFLTRVAFFPIAIKNYGLSVLEVRFSVYFAAALLTGLPFSAIWVYSGHVVENFALLLANPTASRHNTEMTLLLVGTISALLLLGVVGLYTRKYVLGLAEEEEKAGPAKATSSEHKNLELHGHSLDTVNIKMNKERLFVYSPIDKFVMTNVAEFNNRKVISAEHANANVDGDPSDATEKNCRRTSSNYLELG